MNSGPPTMRLVLVGHQRQREKERERELCQTNVSMAIQLMIESPPQTFVFIKLKNSSLRNTHPKKNLIVVLD